ncbi:MAG: multicopper oxidase domain-containing protein [Candidatus Sulfomarinibacteraceae bacterium]
MDRREFIKQSTLTAAAFGMSGLTTLVPRDAQAAAVDVSFAAEGVVKSMIDGTSIFTWQFRDLSGFGPGGLSSGLVVMEGDAVDITVYNDLDRSINLEVPGVLEGTPVVAPGGSRIYSFTAPPAGSYFYHDAANGEIGRAMGLAGPLIVMPADGSNRLYAGGPVFDRQYTLVLHELDDRLNSAVSAGGTYDMTNYEPNYFFVNGLSYPNTAGDGDTLVAMNVGEQVALRFVNTGVITNPMHFHGYHVDVATRDRIPETTVIAKDTVLVKVGECVDVILSCNQPGAYPLHTHYVPGVTANGVYVNPYGGALIVMSAS